MATGTVRMLIGQLAKLNRDSVFAYPSVNNAASNAPRKRLGFTLTEGMGSEYQPNSGLLLRCNAWIPDLVKYRENKSHCKTKKTEVDNFLVSPQVRFSKIRCGKIKLTK